MTRIIHEPTIDKTKLSLNIPKGGTDDIAKLEAAAKLGLVTTNEYNANNGVAQTDASGKIPAGLLSNIQIGGPNVNSKKVLTAGSLHQFTITNYDFKTPYTVTATAGTVIRTDDIIAYRAPTTAGTYTLTVNNNTITIIVVDNVSSTPSIISPTNVSIDNSTITHIVASPYATDGSLEIGTLLASDAVAGDLYGVTVSLNNTGTILAVGSHVKDTVAGVNAGQIYIYDWDAVSSTWIERSKLTASDGAASDQYGISVSLDSTGAILAVGAFAKDTVVGTQSGQVYIYDWDAVNSTWIERSKVTASDGATNDLYGSDVSLNSTGTILAVGAYRKDTVAGIDAGQVYIYDWDAVSSTWIERSKVTASDAVAGDLYGSSVSLDSTGTILAVGSILKDTVAGVDAGQVYIYDWDTVSSTWIERTLLTASDGAASDQYGVSVSLDSTGTILAVGSHGKDTVAGIDAGQAYIYDWDAVSSTWIERSILTASDGAVNDLYGSSVALNSTASIMIVGAWGKDTVAGVNAGQVYMVTPSYHTSSDWQLATDVDFTNIVKSSLNDTVHLESWDVSGLAIATDYYVRVRYHANQYGPSAWSPVSEFTTKTNNIPTLEYLTLRASDAAVSDNYSVSLVLNGDGTIMIAGASGKDTVAGANAGQVYIYDWDAVSSTWIERVKLLASDAAASDFYGSSASLNSTGTILAVGSYAKDTVAGVDAGQVYIYDWNSTSSTWIERSKLLASDGTAGDFYGTSVSLDSTGTILAVGALSKDTIGGVDAGQVYIYDWNSTSSTWVERVKLLASDGSTNDHFGISTSLDSTGTVLAVGASLKNTINGTFSGQVYIYDWDVATTTWVERVKLLASDGAASDQYGEALSIDGTGTILSVGAILKDTVAGANAGQVYIYDWDAVSSAWIERSILRASDGTASDFYGRDIALSNNATIMLVGSYLKDTVVGLDAGQVYMYI